MPTLVIVLLSYSHTLSSRCSFPGEAMRRVLGKLSIATHCFANNLKPIKVLVPIPKDAAEFLSAA